MSEHIVAHRGADAAYELAPLDHRIEVAGSRHMVRQFLIPLLTSLGIRPGDRILDVGCGIGESVWELRAAGYDAYGLEPAGASTD